jgi:cytochrome c5
MSPRANRFFRNDGDREQRPVGHEPTRDVARNRFGAPTTAVCRGATAVVALLCAAACTTPQQLSDSPARAVQTITGLPPGQGREILAAACTSCHDLGGLGPFRGYYDAARWRRLVETMIAHGAKLDETEVTALVDYLVEHFGPSTD